MFPETKLTLCTVALLLRSSLAAWSVTGFHDITPKAGQSGITALSQDISSRPVQHVRLPRRCICVLHDQDFLELKHHEPQHHSNTPAAVKEKAIDFMC